MVCFVGFQGFVPQPWEAASAISAGSLSASSVARTGDHALPPTGIVGPSLLTPIEALDPLRALTPGRSPLAVPTTGAGKPAGPAVSTTSTVRRPVAGTLFAPLDALVPSSSFGYRTSPISGEPGEFHTGQDYAAPCGTLVYAADAGTVRAVGWHAWGGGNRVEIDHGNGLITSYNHLQGVSVQKGDTVNGGDSIAELGTTGSSTGCHLHFETILDGEHVDPTRWKMAPAQHGKRTGVFTDYSPEGTRAGDIPGWAQSTTRTDQGMHGDLPFDGLPWNGNGNGNANVVADAGNAAGPSGATAPGRQMPVPRPDLPAASSGTTSMPAEKRAEKHVEKAGVPRGQVVPEKSTPKGAVPPSVGAVKPGPTPPKPDSPKVPKPGSTTPPRSDLPTVPKPGSTTPPKSDTPKVPKPGSTTPPKSDTPKVPKPGSTTPPKSDLPTVPKPGSTAPPKSDLPNVSKPGSTTPPKPDAEPAPAPKPEPAPAPAPAPKPEPAPTPDPATPEAPCDAESSTPEDPETADAAAGADATTQSETPAGAAEPATGPVTAPAATTPEAGTGAEPGAEDGTEPAPGAEDAEAPSCEDPDAPAEPAPAPTPHTADPAAARPAEDAAATASGQG